MRALTWLTSLEIGIEEIDADHKELFDLFVGCDQALAAGDCKGFCAGLDRLVSDFAAHFTREVNVLQKVGYPGVDGHEAEHGAFMRQLNALRERCTGKASTKTLNAEFENAFSFLIRDILSSDTHFKSYLQDKGVCDPRSFTHS